MRVSEPTRSLRARLGDEGGYTMIAVIGAIALVSMLAAATLAATNGDVNLVQHDVDYKRAHAAAEAGLADYSFHLNNDNSYWAKCTNVPSPPSNPSAVNQVGSTANRRAVPESDAEYAIELLPATGQKECNTAKPVESMLEQSGSNTGTFRIKSTGYSGGAKASVVATYKRASLLDYIYFTQYETSDPVTYDSDTIKSAKKQCPKFRREGRQNVPLENNGGQPCDTIVFVTGDNIKGPMHTNDDFAICGTPTFGRNASDVIEVGSPPQGWIDGHCSGYGTANPNFKGPFVTTAPVLKPPATNESLEKLAGPEYTFSCQTEIKLEGTKMKVTTRGGKEVTMPFPSSGVVYVKQGSCPDIVEYSGGKHPHVTAEYHWPECSAEYSPFNATYASYPSGSDCGTVYVSGSYSGELTIAAERDIVIQGNLTNSGQGLLGLIANNFVRVKHECSGFKLENLKVEAAILAIEHSFIVDHYDCGSSLGNLTVKGAISQKYRGAVGTTGGTGYLKNYEYDDRLRYMEPPHFLNPIEPAWHIQRETLSFE